jgi:hypothetical protein
LSACVECCILLRTVGSGTVVDEQHLSFATPVGTPGASIVSGLAARYFTPSCESATANATVLIKQQIATIPLSARLRSFSDCRRARVPRRWLALRARQIRQFASQTLA